MVQNENTKIILPHCKDLYTIFQKEFVQKSRWQKQTRSEKEENCITQMSYKVW